MKDSFLKRFVELGAKPEDCKKWAEEGLAEEALQKEPDEMEVLVKAIKNYSKEKKA